MTEWITRHGRRIEVEILGQDDDAPQPKKRSARRRFTMVPQIWERELAKADVSGSTYAVALVLLYEAAMMKRSGRHPTVKLTNNMLAAPMSAHRKRVALRTLVTLRLADVEWLPGHSPIVTVYLFDGEAARVDPVKN